MITAANITYRNGAIDMVDYYCENTDYLSNIKKILVDGGYTGKNFLMLSKQFQMLKLRLLSEVSCIHLPFFLNAGLWSVLLVGLINVVVFGKTANVNYKTLFK